MNPDIHFMQSERTREKKSLYNSVFPTADNMIMLATEAWLDCNHFKPFKQYLLFEVAGTNYYRNRDPFCCPPI